MVRIPAIANAREWAEHHSTLKDFYLYAACKAAGITAAEAEARRLPSRVKRRSPPWSVRSNWSRPGETCRGARTSKGSATQVKGGKLMLTFTQAVHEAMRLQAQLGAPAIDIECSSPDPNTVLCYLLFDHEWHVIGFTAPRPYDREQCEEAFVKALAYDSEGVTIH